MNIYQIEQDLLAIFDEIEAQGGEITPEIEQQLVITQETFKEKIEDYTKVIKLLNNDIDSIKLEQKRLKDLADKKQKTIDNLKKIILNAINQFGNTKKSGVKYLDYGTGEVSIRTTTVVDVDTDLLDKLKDAIYNITEYNKTVNQLDVEDHIDINTIINVMNTSMNGFDNPDIYEITSDDLNNTNVELTVKLPVSDLINGKSYSVIREIAKATDVFKLDVNVSKTDLKKKLEENGSCAPNIAKLVQNQTLTIK